MGTTQLERAPEAAAPPVAHMEDPTMKSQRLALAVLALAAASVTAPNAALAAPAAQEDEGGVIEGSVFLDADGDGVFDPEERPLAGFEVMLEGADERTVVTQTNGRFRFEDLEVGAYSVGVELSEEQRDAYVSSIRFEDLRIEGSEILSGIDFGFQERDAVAAEATDDAMAEDEDAAEGEGDDAADADAMASDEAGYAGADAGEGDEAEADAAVETMTDDEGVEASDVETAEVAEPPAMTAAGMMPALTELLETAAAAGQTVDDLDPAARRALDEAIAELPDPERAALARAMTGDGELAELARKTGADALVAGAAGADRAMVPAQPAPTSQVNDMPQTGAEDLVGWPALLGLIALLGLLGTAGMAAERRAA